MFYRILLILLLSLSLAGCGKSPKLPALPPEATLLAFGDSLTYGTGASPAESYPAILATLIKRPIINAGVPGETTTDGLRRLEDELDGAKPDLLILCLGGNDFLRKQPENITIDNLRAMLVQARSRNIPVLLVATPRPGLGLSTPAFYSELAKEFGIPLEAESLEEILSDSTLKSDLIHPNAQGYRKLAEALAALLDQAGAI